MDTNRRPIFVIPVGASNAQGCAHHAVDRRSRPSPHWTRPMADKPASSQQRYLRTTEAARFLGLSGRTLEKHRTHGTGPSYRKLGGRVVYALEDLQAWADIGLRQSTSDSGKGVVHAAKPVPGLGPLAGPRSR
jgi:predicted DNA-binding transcriptional regulator AlpA